MAAKKQKAGLQTGNTPGIRVRVITKIIGNRKVIEEEINLEDFIENN
jgi:hypothetical protein